MKKWIVAYRLMTTVVIAMLWCCVQNRLDWQKDTNTGYSHGQIIKD